MDRLLSRLVRRAALGLAVCAAALAPAPAAASAAARATAATLTAALPSAAAPSAATSSAAAPSAAARSKRARATKAAKRARRAAARRSARAGRASRTRAVRSRAVRSRAVRGSALLRGSPAAVDRAYDEAQSEGLAFTRSSAEIERGVEEGEYVSLRGGAWRLKGVATPYARPEARAFLRVFAPEYQRACGEPLTVTSAMRPTSVRLRNSVAKTVHPTGIAVDLRTPRNGCRAWMRTALIGYERQGVVEATEEHRPAHFHVAVLRAP